MKDTIKQLQMIEQSLHSIFMQKQQFQAQLIEIESALVELNKAKSSYKIIGNIMVSSTPAELKKDMESKKELFLTRVKVLEKQEDKFKEEADKLRKEVSKAE